MKVTGFQNITKYQRLNLISLIYKCISQNPVLVKYVKDYFLKDLPEEKNFLTECAKESCQCKSPLVSHLPKKNIDFPAYKGGGVQSFQSFEQENELQKPTSKEIEVGNDKTPIVYQSPAIPPRKRITRQSAGGQNIKDLLQNEGVTINKDVAIAYAKYLENSAGTIAAFEGESNYYLRAKEKLGCPTYNKRQYAKHINLYKQYLQKYKYAIAYTLTMGAEYNLADGTQDDSAFIKDFRKNIERLRHNRHWRDFETLEYGEEKRLHIHGTLFFNELPYGMEEGIDGNNVSENTKQWLGSYLNFKSFETVQWLDKARWENWFNYCHKYTKYTYKDVLQRQKNVDEERKKEGIQCLENLLLCLKNDTPHIISSGKKGLQKALTCDIKEDMNKKTDNSDNAVQNSEYNDLVGKLERFASGQLDEKEGLVALNRAIELVFPCASKNQFIINTEYAPRAGGKIAEWRKKALAGSEIKQCHCFFNDLYKRNMQEIIKMSH